MRRALGLLALIALAALVALVGWASSAGSAWADEPIDPDAPSLSLLAKQGPTGQVARVPKIKVGEPFQVLVIATAKTDVLVNLPASFDAGDFEVLDRKETASPDGAEKRFDLTVVAWKPGQLSLPGIPITYIAKGKGDVKQIKTAPLDVEVEAVLGEPEKADLRPLAPPVDVYVKDWTLVYVAAAVGGAVVLGGIGFIIGRVVKRRRRRAAPAELALDLRAPHEIALERLRLLERSGRLDEVDRRPFYFEVTEIVRDYLGRRFGFDALDMTSFELLGALERAAAPEPVRADVERWLAGCDLIKYARVAADHGEASATLASAVTLVEASRPPAPSPPAPKPAPAMEATHVG
jgi:hypothetical protein